jgi:hypothetical protein
MFGRKNVPWANQRDWTRGLASATLVTTIKRKKMKESDRVQRQVEAEKRAK